jgi:hypothetical protein
MAFGLITQQRSSGDFADIVKYDANAGRLFRVDYDPALREKESIDITSPPPRFAIDFGSLEIGFVHFSANGPDFLMVPEGSPPPKQPEDVDDKGRLKYQEAFRVKLFGRVLNGLREWSSAARSVVDVVEHMYNDYRVAPEAREGKIPIVELTKTVPINYGSRTVYAPHFTIVGWTARTSEFGRRTVPAPAAPKPPANGGVDALEDEIPF